MGHGQNAQSGLLGTQLLVGGEFLGGFTHRTTDTLRATEATDFQNLISDLSGFQWSQWSQWFASPERPITLRHAPQTGLSSMLKYGRCLSARPGGMAEIISIY